MTSPGHTAFTGAGGITLAATRHGSAGAPVMLLHGGGQTRHAFDKSARRIAAAGFLALTVDQRGHGESGRARDGAYSFFEFAADAEAVARHLQAATGRKPIAIGASMGGLAALIAQGTGADKPFAGLVLVDITPDMNRDGVDAVQNFMRAKADQGFANVEEAGAAIAAYLPHRPKPKSLAGLAKNLRLGPDKRYYWHWDPVYMNGPRSIDALAMEAVGAAKAAAKVFDVPVLLVRGSNSELVGEEQLARFKAMAPEAEFADVRGARHMVAGDDNDAFSAVIVSFLARHFAPAR